MNILPFTPSTAGTVSISVSGSSQRVLLGFPAAPYLQGGQVMVTSPAGGTIAFINFGDVTASASASTATPILPGSVMVFTAPTAPAYAAAIGTSGTTLYFSVGQGS